MQRLQYNLQTRSRRDVDRCIDRWRPPINHWIDGSQYILAYFIMRECLTPPDRAAYAERFIRQRFHCERSATFIGRREGWKPFLYETSSGENTFLKSDYMHTSMRRASLTWRSQCINRHWYSPRFCCGSLLFTNNYEVSHLSALIDRLAWRVTQRGQAGTQQTCLSPNYVKQSHRETFELSQ